jgi:hypothetical protein
MPRGVYQSRIDDYRGESLKVTGSVARKPGDVIVNTVITGGQISQPLPVSWRVLGGGADLEGRRRPVQGHLAGHHPAAGLRLDDRQRRRQHRRADQSTPEERLPGRR